MATSTYVLLFLACGTEYSGLLAQGIIKEQFLPSSRSNQIIIINYFVIT